MANIKSSSEFQEIVLSTIMKDNYLFSKLRRFMNESYFEKVSYKLFYRSLNYFFEKYSKLPSFKELVVLISDNYKSEYGDLEAIKMECKSLYETPPYEESFVLDKLTSFIKRANVETVLKTYLPKLNSGDEVAIEDIGEDLVEGLNFNLTRSNSMKLGDIEKLDDVRTAAVGNESNPILIKSSFEGINQALQFKAYKPGDLIMIVAAPGVGKTMFITNELKSAAEQGFNSLHIYLGDMKEYDGFIRYTSCITNILQDELVQMGTDEQKRVIMQHNYSGIFNRIIVTSYAAQEITIDEMMQEVYRLQAEMDIHFDMIGVDYADNLIPESDMMYESGGNIYNKLSLLCTINKSVVIVGSQPKTQYWNDEIIPKNGAADSSRKQHVIDVMATMGMTQQGSTVGSIFLAKVRRGKEGKIIRIKTNFERAHMESLREEDYLRLKGQQ